MALSVAKSMADGLYYVSGLTRQNTPFPIGRHYFRPGNGPLHVGFDDSFADPLVVKAFYDPTGQTLTGAQYVGFMQFMQINFCGTPIPPEVYGGKFADRAPYMCDRTNGFVFVDFMGPKHANLLKPSDDSFEPFYPYNGMLIDGTARSRADLSNHPIPNGSFLTATGNSDTQSLAASLFAEVPVSLVTESDVARFVSNDNLLEALEVTRQQLSEKEPYEIALDYLSREGRMLAGITPAEVSGQVIGDYVLITLPDDEEFTPSLCVTLGTREGKQYVLAYLIDYYDMASMQEDAVLLALKRIYEFLKGEHLNLPDVTDESMEATEDSPPPVEDSQPPVRGSSGLMTPRFILKPDEFHVELKYWTLVVAGMKYLPRSGRTTTRFLCGFTWSALLRYDSDTQSLDLTSIRAPTRVNAFNYEAPLTKYFAALTDPQLGNMTIDMSNFTKAAMRRQNFGADVKPNYVNGQGVVITT
ncbi:MAG: hypothetical protein H7Z16_05660 [Pyrinomonadaceae bacterium]|nr:hypothetical protein [Pyrinomonadaceae bacterium]